MRRPRAVGFAMVAVGLAVLLVSVHAAAGLSSTSSQPALPPTISGTQEVQLPPCGGQSANNCVVNASWTSALMTPDQAAAYYAAIGAESGSFNECGLIALWRTTITSPSVLPLPTWGGSQDDSFYGGYQLMSTSIPNYPGSPYAAYSTADGCTVYNSGASSTTSTASKSTTTTSTSSGSTTTSAASTTTASSQTVTHVSDTSVSTTAQGSAYGKAPAPDYPLALLGSVVVVLGSLVAARGRFL